MKFPVPNYNCLQNPWLGGYRPQIPVLSVLNWICWTPPKKCPRYAIDDDDEDDDDDDEDDDDDDDDNDEKAKWPPLWFRRGKKKRNMKVE